MALLRTETCTNGDKFHCYNFRLKYKKIGSQLKIIIVLLSGNFSLNVFIDKGLQFVRTDDKKAGHFCV